MRKGKWYTQAEVSFLVTVHMEADEGARPPSQKKLKALVEDAIGDMLDVAEETTAGVHFCPPEVRSIERPPGT